MGESFRSFLGLLKLVYSYYPRGLPRAPSNGVSEEENIPFGGLLEAAFRLRGRINSKAS